MRILNLWKCLFVKATTTLLTNTLNTIRCGAVIVTRPLKMHSLWYREYFAIKESKKERCKLYQLEDLFNVHWTLNISFIIWAVRCLRKHRTFSFSIRFYLVSFLFIHSLLLLLFGFTFHTFIFYSTVARSLAQSASVYASFMHSTLWVMKFL